MRDLMLCVVITICCSMLCGVYCGIQMKSLFWGLFFGALPMAVNGLLGVVAWIESNS